MITGTFAGFSNFETALEDALKEANYITGYKKIFQYAGLDDDTVAEGLDIIRKVVNARAAIYRIRDSRELAYKNRADAAKAGDQQKVALCEKEIRKFEDKIWVFVLNILRENEPLDNYLAMNEIPYRLKGNVKQDALTYDD